MDKISHMLNAFDVLADIIDTAQPDGMFGFNAILECNGVKIDSRKLDFEFDVPFDDDTQANEAEIIIYNLKNSTISKLARNKTLSITAGYQRDAGVIFSGRISEKNTKRSGVDTVTTLHVLDDQDLEERKIKSITYKKGTRASYILKDLIKRLKLPIAVFKVARDHTYKSSVTVDGELMDNISRYSRICGVSTYINKGKVYTRSLKDGDKTQFKLSADTGLIGSPEEFEEESVETADKKQYKDIVKGYKVQMLLQHRLTTASVLEIKAEDVKGQYRVRSGRHYYDGMQAITECEVI